MSQARGPSARDLAASAPDAGLAIVFLVVWIAPGAALPGTVGYLLLLMMLEFVIIHSSAIMGTVALGEGARRRRSVALVGLAAFYTLFVGGISLAGKSWWPLDQLLGPDRQPRPRRADRPADGPRVYAARNRRGRGGRRDQRPDRHRR